jgi:hypothetical protein
MRLAPDLFAAAPRRRVTGSLVALGLVGLMVAPFVWSAATVADAPGATLPEAGPRTTPGFAFGGFGGRGAPGAPGGPAAAPPAAAAAPNVMIQFLEANQGDARWIVATGNAQTAAPIVLASGDGVMAIGGFTGSDPAITLPQFRSLVAAGEVRYVLVTGGFGRIGGGDSGLILRWASNTCRPVSLANGGSLGSPGELGSGSGLASIGLFGGMALVDCRGF